MSFALLLAKNVLFSFSPLELNGAEFTLSVAKNVALFETVRILCTVKWRDSLHFHFTFTYLFIQDCRKSS